MDRRTILKATGAGIVASAAGFPFSPRQARADDAPMRVLSRDEASLLEAFGEALLPGAREAGIAHFVDAQLAGKSEDCLLVLRYFDWPPPYAGFYKGALAALDAAARQGFNKGFAELSAGEAETMIGQMGGGALAGWSGPPAQLVYLTVRSDAVDVVYGTVEGFEKLGIPYMPHIAPTTKW